MLKRQICPHIKVVRTRGRDGRIRHAGVGRGVSIPVEQEQEIEQPVFVEQPMMQEDEDERIEGPKPELRIASLGTKLTGYVPGPGEHHPNIQGWLDESGLKWLTRTSLSKVDPQILSAFTKRWHPETSSFHMSFGEMTVTLDDVSCLLHIPVRGIFYTPVPVSMEEAAALATELLGVPYEVAYLETSRQRGGTFTQQWVYDCWQRNLHMYHIYDCAARAYLLLLVGCTILTDKSYTRVNAKWLPMFRDLSTLNKFSWASAPLVCLYDNLNDASMFTTHALAGYPTLLQCWIHEYFPTLGRRGESIHRCDDMGYPRAMRWVYKQGKTKLPAYRPIMDALTPSDVIWRPFEGHRGSIPSDLITCFSGYLCGCTVVPYLPERCLRQFGFVQYIPPPPHPAPSYTDIDSLWSGYHTSVDRILQFTRPVRFDAETTVDYLSWYYTVSHHILCRLHDGPHGAPPVPQFVPAYAPPQDAPAQDAPPAHAPPSGEQ
ncbi:hypothetical protein TSUD_57140 [Trifolium subterraneum]|uniref:Aminotransferase-like plant mobile domain-containing protein n=1 Tax=Trifolium subterraneum TaxID=3900 RepID=A0A2Z6NHG2_TRISU|nr:hypothetical protein TSUD_57140 [Trifolium subterraneum]